MTPLRRLIAAAGLTNLGDGIAVLAWAWAASLLTRDAVWVAMVPIAVRLPWVFGAIPAGLLADRHARRQLALVADFVRTGAFAAVAGVLALATVPEAPRLDGAPPLLWGMIVAALLVGGAEVVRDSAASTLLPQLVPSEGLERANGRLWAAELVGNALAGPALGAVLIGVALAAPFAVASGLYLSGALIMLGLHATQAPRPAPQPWRAALGESWTFLKTQPFLMQLVWITGGWNLLSEIALIALVLHVQENLGLSAPIFGLILAAGAVGGVLGGMLGDRAVTRFGPSRTAQAALVLGLPCFLIVAVAPGAWAVALALALFEFGGLLWNTVSTAYRQRRVPDALRGRVHALYRLVSFAAVPVGMLISGALVEGGAWLGLSRDFALILPFVVTSIGLLAFTLVIWRSVGDGFGASP